MVSVWEGRAICGGTERVWGPVGVQEVAVGALQKEGDHCWGPLGLPVYRDLQCAYNIYFFFNVKAHLSYVA